MAIQYSRWPNEQEMTPQAWARGPDFRIVQPCCPHAAALPEYICLDGRPLLSLSNKQLTTAILQSLQQGNIEALNVKADGRIMNGNTRFKILEERGVGVNSLSREMLS
jgi:hypothetical protein